jgi:uncharacterized heparinase superfamily protein
MSFRNLCLYYHSLKRLRLSQIFYRLYYKVRRLHVIPLPEHAVATAQVGWAGPCYLEQRYFDDDRVCLLGEEGAIAQAGDWNSPSKSKLWLYNLHYFDDLNANNSESRVMSHRRLIRRWIAENPPAIGNGWEPYPISLRLVNWVKWCWRERVNDDLIVRSIAQQADALVKQLEYHILGNHLFANAKALVFAGLFLTGKEAKNYLKKGLRILRREVREQFLSDGGHFELSPMYHAIMVWDLLDLINCAQSSGDPELTAEVASWRTLATRALSWLQVMTHPDGEISFFNDSAMGIAATPAQIFAYARQLGIALPEKTSQAHALLQASGYSRVTLSDQTVLIDHAAVGADYLPGHAHADSLSFEWSVEKQRVLVNSGTSLYGVSEERLRQRGTEAHNTVVVDGEDSSEVWSGFRVARRARTKLVNVSARAGGVTLVMAHDGYTRLPGQVIHERTLCVSEKELQVTDCLRGCFQEAAALYHFHPDVSAERRDERHIEITLPSGTQVLMSADSPIEKGDSTWHPRFGSSVPNVSMKVAFTAHELRVTFSLLPRSRA